MSHSESWRAGGPSTGRWRVGALLALAPFSGCTLVSSDHWTWLWFVVPFAFFAIGTVFVFDRRKRQIESWDLRSAPEVPSRTGIIKAVIAFGAAAFLAFSIFNVMVDMDPRQKGLNIGLWFVGTAIGSTLALLLGLRWAEPKPLAGAPGES